MFRTPGATENLHSRKYALLSPYLLINNSTSLYLLENKDGLSGVNMF